MRYLPIALGVLLIVGLTIPQFIMTDRLSGTNVTAEEQAKLLANVPDEIGDWHGVNLEIDEKVRKQAGAIGAISRQYRNSRTGQVVDLWLIVGHARGVVGHTPDICYPSSGFEMRAKENSVYPLSVEGQPEATFLTNTFFREDSTGRRIQRVFWAWYNCGDDDDRASIEWEGPANPRLKFGNSRALFKMYFSAQMPDQMETAEQSACLKFARDFLPVVNKALAVVYSDNPVAAKTETPSAAPVATPTGEAATPEAATAPAITGEEATTEPAATAVESPAAETPAVETPAVAPSEEKK